MRAFISGVAGFIGSHLAERLLKDGWEVAGIDNLSTGRRENVPDGVEFVEGDVVEGIDASFDVIWHLAASYRDREAWEQDARVNVLGTIAAVRAAQREDARLVYCQTSLCYARTEEPFPLPVDHPLDPKGSYAVTKTAGEAFIRDSGVPYVSLRLANIYGPRNLSGPIPTFYKRLSEGRPCTIVDTRRDFVFIDDMIWVAVTAGHRGQGVYHVSSGEDISIAEAYRAIVTAMGVEVEEPEPDRPGPDDVASILLDPRRTASEFGWRARTPLAGGIRAAVDWYRANGVGETYTHLQVHG